MMFMYLIGEGNRFRMKGIFWNGGPQAELPGLLVGPLDHSRDDVNTSIHKTPSDPVRDQELVHPWLR